MTALTMQKLDKKVCYVLGICCIIFVFLLIPISLRVYAAAPPQSQQQIIDTDQRLTRLETESDEIKAKFEKIDAVAAEARLTRLESSLDTIKNLLIALVTGIGLMLLEAGHRLLKPRDIIDLQKD